MSYKGFAALALVSAVTLAGSGFRAVGQERKDRQQRPEFTQKGEMEKTKKDAGSRSDERFGYTSLQGSYAPMGEGSNDGHGEGIFNAGTPVSKFYKVNLQYFHHGTIGTIPGDIYKSTVGGKEYYLLFSDQVYSDGYARIIVWREGFYTVYHAGRATQA